ncbi:sugar transferase [Coprobacillaceae bacterium CR2/5/TPMF4]|nr:sugar transferase [Coprobacillaceae bacterium CR2/5/TPMF4]
MYRKYIKRILDFILSLIALVILSPIILVIAILVRIKLGSPVIFKQKRPGLNEKIFTLYKFRTMTDAKDENGNLLPDNIRLTKFGKILRSTSLDELPELFNILKGDMSIVGPRPLLVKYLPLYNKSQKHRHDVRPGFTGWAQCNGRNALSWEEKFDLDIYYVNHVSFL